MHNADLTFQAHGVVQGHHLGTGQHLVVHLLEIAVKVELVVRRVVAHHVRAVGIILRLVDGAPQLDPVAKGLKADLGIGFKIIHDGAFFPTAFFCNGIGQVIVEQRNIGFNALFQAVVDHIVVKFNALGVHFAPAIGQDACPCNGEAVGILPAGGHQVDILFIAMIKITGDITGSAVQVQRIPVGEHVPLAQTLAILIPSAFALIRGSCTAPEKLLLCHIVEFLSFKKSEHTLMPAAAAATGINMLGFLHFEI